MRLPPVALLRGLRLAAAALAAGSVTGCHDYYSHYRYTPSREVHEIRRENQGGTPDAVVSVELVGIVEPDEGPPRLQVHFLLENSSSETLTLPLAGVEAVPSSVLVLHPENQIDSVEVAPGEHRHVEVYFPLPADESLSNSALADVELHWQVRLGNRVHDSRAIFHGESRPCYYYDYYPWGYYGPWYGPYYYPYYYPYYPFGFYGSYWHCY